MTPALPSPPPVVPHIISMLPSTESLRLPPTPLNVTRVSHLSARPGISSSLRYCPSLILRICSRGSLPASPLWSLVQFAGCSAPAVLVSAGCIAPWPAAGLWPALLDLLASTYWPPTHGLQQRVCCLTSVSVLCLSPTLVLVPFAPNFNNSVSIIRNAE